jgi:hypothetical protein
VNDSASFEDAWAERAASAPPAPWTCGEGASRTFEIPNVVHTADGKRICRYAFKELFESSTTALGGRDFALIADAFDAIFISDIKSFNTGGHSIDGLRRLVLFIDACYDARVEMLFDADCDIGELWDSEKEVVYGVNANDHGDLLGTADFVPVDTFTRFSLDRTVSRIFEMVSSEYVRERGAKLSRFTGARNCTPSTPPGPFVCTANWKTLRAGTPRRAARTGRRGRGTPRSPSPRSRASCRAATSPSQTSTGTGSSTGTRSGPC